MKKWMIVFIVLVLAATAWAKDVRVTVAWEFDSEFESSMTMFKLYYQDPADPAIIYHVTDVTDLSLRTLDTSVLNLPAGKTTNFLISAVYDDGTEEISEPLPWKFTGKPTVLSVNKL